MQGDDLAVAAAVPVTEEKVEESEEKHQQQPPQHEEAVNVEAESGTPESTQAEVGEMHDNEVKAADDEVADKSVMLEEPTEVSPQVEEEPKVAESAIADAPAAAEPVIEATSTEAFLEASLATSTQPGETLSLSELSKDATSKHQQDDALKPTAEDAPSESVTKDIAEVSEVPAQETEDSTAEFVDAPNTMMETANEGDDEPVVKESVDEDQKKEVEAVDEKSVVEVESSDAPKSTANESSEEEKSSQQVPIISSSATTEETATVDSPQTHAIENQPEVANKISTREYVQTPPMSAAIEEKSLTVSEPAEKEETSEATPTSTITQENSVEEKSVQENGSAVPAAVVAKENGDDEKVSSQPYEPSVQLKELQSNGDDAATKDSVAAEEAVKEDDKKSESLEQLLVKEGTPSAPTKSNGAVDEEKILEEMRAKIAEQDPLSKDTDEATLRRFLRARSWKLSKAVKMFVDHQKWRRSFVPLGHIPQEQVKNELEAEKVFLQGNDKNGRPVAVILAAKHDANKRKFDEFKRYLVFNFDTTVASLKPGEETFTVILDLKGLALKNLDVRGWISTFDFLQAYYPERLGRLFIVHVPKIFWGAWKLVHPFIDKVTRDKIVFVEDKLLEQKLQEEIEKDQIPDIYGGTLPLVPIQNVVIPNWPPRQEDAIPQSTS